MPMIRCPLRGSSKTRACIRMTWGLVTTHTAGANPRVSNSGLEWNLRISILNQSNAAAAGSGPHSENHSLRETEPSLRGHETLPSPAWCGILRHWVLSHDLTSPHLQRSHPLRVAMNMTQNNTGSNSHYHHLQQLAQLVRDSQLGVPRDPQFSSMLYSPQ